MANHRNTHAAFRSGRRHTSRIATRGAAITVMSCRESTRARCQALRLSGGTVRFRSRPERSISIASGPAGQLLPSRKRFRMYCWVIGFPSTATRMSPLRSSPLPGGPTTSETRPRWSGVQSSLTPSRW